MVGYLGHDPVLSADTVEANVLCGSEEDTMPYLAAAALKDEVLAMEDGKTTVGTHDELMASVPAYRRLYESQTGGERHEGQK